MLEERAVCTTAFGVRSSVVVAVISPRVAEFEEERVDLCSCRALCAVFVPAAHHHVVDVLKGMENDTKASTRCCVRACVRRRVRVCVRARVRA